MVGDTYAVLVLTASVLWLLQTGAHARVEESSSITLPDWRSDAEYVTKCDFNSDISPFCEWTSEGLMSGQAGTGEYPLSLETNVLSLSGEACLEFWYRAPLGASGSELRALLSDRSGLKEVWSSPAQEGGDWRQVFVPLSPTEEAQVVLVAAQGQSGEGQVAFDRVGVRNGQCGTQCSPDAEFWTDESTRCLCSAGQLSCAAESEGICTVHSDFQCSTFDGAVFRFARPCTYVLARSCSSAGPPERFSVEAESDPTKNSSLNSVRRVNVELEGLRVSMLRWHSNRVMINGIWRELPLSLSERSVKIRSNAAAVVLETRFGLSVSYDAAGVVQVKAPASFSGKVCGVCGNFNRRRDDDQWRPDGSDASSADDLVESWQSPGGRAPCEHAPMVPHPCQPSQEAEYSSEPYCGTLVARDGPFAGCLSVLRPSGSESYFRSCVAGMCASGGDPAALCETMQAFADLCLKAGVLVPTWRNSSLCPLECGENSHYNACAEGCPEVCSSMDASGLGTEACGSCVERCECDRGFRLSGGRCVPAEDCGCWMKGDHYEKGVAFMDGECERECRCLGGGVVECLSTSCAPREVCKVQDGVRGCHTSDKATCRVYGDPHYISFDGRAYVFQGGCNYTLATTSCGHHSPVPFTVTSRNQNPGNLTWSRLDSVALQVQGLHVVLKNNMDVYVNGAGPAPLPYSTNGTYGSVTVEREGRYVFLNTTFGLTMRMDGEGRLFLAVDERHKGKVCGLCGTYSDDQNDDFLMPNGHSNETEITFGNSWRQDDDYHCVAYPDEPQVCDSALEDQGLQECYKLLTGEAFRPCHLHLHAGLYFESCIEDYCWTGGDRRVLCASMESYVAACQVMAGVELGNWTDGTTCADVPPTTLPTPSTPDQRVCPLNCNFNDNLCGWEQLVQDSFDWTRKKGATPSDLTGPSQDTTGVGYYMYIEGDGVYHGDSARLLSSPCQLTGQFCLRFAYHMYGRATAMALNIYQLLGNRATKVWSRTNNQGPEWHHGAIDINVSEPYHIIVEGIRGSDPQSDVALDDISIHYGSCSGASGPGISGPAVPPIYVEGPVKGPVTVPHPVCNLDCAFDNNLCNWNQLATDAFDWTWQSGSTPTLRTGPSSDHTRGDVSGHYMYIEASSVTHGDTARLLSSECSDPGPQCLQFWYHMYGSANTMGLQVYLLQDRYADGLWWKRNDQGDAWHLAQVDLSTTGPFQIIFEGRRGSNDESDVAIDDVSLRRGRCADLIKPTTPAQTTPSKTESPKPPTTARPQPPTTERPQPPTTERPQPPTTTTPPPTERPQPPTTARPQPPKTERPQPPTTAKPQPPTTARPQPPHPVCNVDCGFDNNLCSWNQLVTDAFDWTWQSGSTPTLRTGPSSDHTRGDVSGHYMYIEASNVTYGDTARLLSSECSDPGPQCLQFWYHMYGSANTMGLQVYLLQDRYADGLWWKRNDQGDAWHLAQVDLSTTGPFQIIFEGRRGSNDESDVAIDDVSLRRGRCADLIKPTIPAQTTAPNERPKPPTTARPQPPTTERPQPPTTERPQPPTTERPQPPTTTTPPPTERPQPPTTARPQPPKTERPQPPTTAKPRPPTTARPQPPHPVCNVDCGFDNNLCSWNQLVTDAFDWTWQSGSTPTLKTGPSSDHTRGDVSGHYMYIEASNVTYGDTARLLSSECSDPGPQCLQFWYHMYGSANTMGLQVYLLQDRYADGLWWKREDQGDTWHLAQVDLTTSGPFQIIFEGRRGSNDESDVAIDDVSLHRGRCADLIKPTTPAQTTPPKTERPKPPTTAQPQPPSERPQPPTTERPQSPTTATPPTTERPQPTTARPQPPTTARPQPPTTERPQPPTTARPQPPTTARPQPPTTERPQPPTTERPLPPTTEKPQPPTTARPQPPTTERPQPPTTERPQPPTTERPQPPTTEKPQPPTTERPQPTTARPQPPTTEIPEPPTTARPQPTTARPKPPTTARPKPPTTARPTPSCPKNSHYTTCISACQPTCNYLQGTPNCQKDESCVEGCVCNDGFLLRQRVCVPIQRCGCVDANGNSHHFNEVWYTKHCRQKCECEKDNGVGEIECDDEDECDGDSVCLQNKEGQYYCKSTDFSECSINGDPEYRTFDDMKHGFEGRYSYVLVQTTGLPGDLPEVYIEGINGRVEGNLDDNSIEEDDSHSHSRSSDSDEDSDEDSEENDDMHLRALKIRVYNHTVEFRKNRKLLLDGRRTRTPVSPSGGLEIRERSSRLYLKTDFGLSVEFDGSKRAEIALPHVYKRRVGGLCGNFDGRRRNDLMKPNGDQARSLREFGESWRVTEEALSVRWRGSSSLRTLPQA